jgi:hypothetical protein
VLEIGPEWRRFRRHGSREAEGETARETENLAIWGGESDRAGVPRAVGIPGAGGVGRQKFRFSVFREADTRKTPVAGIPYRLSYTHLFSFAYMRQNFRFSVFREADIGETTRGRQVSAHTGRPDNYDEQPLTTRYSRLSNLRSS